MKLKPDEFEFTIHIKDGKIEKCRTCNWEGQTVWKKVNLKNGSRQKIVFPFSTVDGRMELGAELRWI